MRKSSLVVVVVSGLASLACAGLPLPVGEEVIEEPAGEALAELDVADATPITVATLEPTADGCAWTARSWPDDATVTIAAARVACPTTWVSAADEGHAAVLGQAGGALVTGEVASPVAAAPAAPEAVGFDGDVLVICARVEAELLEEPRRFRLDGKDHEAPDQEALARSWRFEGGAWAVGETAPVAVAGHARPCAELPAFPDGDVASAPAVQPDEDDFSPAEGADLAALKALQDGAWAVAEGGWIAATTGASEEDPGVRPPVAWRAEGGPWKLVENVGQASVFVARGPWLLVTEGAASRLLDARKGAEVWTASTVAMAWPEGVSVPEVWTASTVAMAWPEGVSVPEGHPAGAEKTEPGEAEEDEPSGPAGPRAKAGHKRPPGTGAKAPGKVGKKAQPVPR